jgi:hypothetical protein
MMAMMHKLLYVPARTGSYRAKPGSGKLGSLLLMKQFHDASEK